MCYSTVTRDLDAHFSYNMGTQFPHGRCDDQRWLTRHYLRANSKYQYEYPQLKGVGARLGKELGTLEGVAVDAHAVSASQTQ